MALMGDVRMSMVFLGRFLRIVFVIRSGHGAYLCGSFWIITLIFLVVGSGNCGIWNLC